MTPFGMLLPLAFVIPSAAVLDCNNAFPNPAHDVPIEKVHINEITHHCNWSAGRLGDVFELPRVHYYPSTADYKNFSGVRLIPQETYDKEHDFFKRLNFPLDDQKIQGARCDVPLPDGSTWTFDRIGPFTSTGNYDWWQMGYSDVWGFEDKLKGHAPGIYLLTTVTAPVNEQDEILGFPPIHAHHIHISPGLLSPVTRRARPSEIIHEMHGDYVCTDDQGGTQCYIEELPDGYAKLVKDPMYMVAELNDVRLKNSAKMTWYVAVGARWMPKDKDASASKSTFSTPKPISFHTTTQPRYFDPEDQLTKAATYLAPTDEETFMWYTGRWQFSGELIRGKTHFHSSITRQMYMFAGPPENIGLTDRFHPENPYDAIRTKTLGFFSNEALRSYMLNSYQESRARKGKHASRIICEANATSDEVDGFFYDRRATVGCQPWHFNRGDQFTVIGFNRILPGMKGLGPHMPHAIPRFIPSHINFFWLYDRHDGESHYSTGLSTQDVDHGIYQDENGGITLYTLAFEIAKMYKEGDTTKRQFQRYLIVSSVIATAIVFGLLRVCWMCCAWLKQCSTQF